MSTCTPRLVDTGRHTRALTRKRSMSATVDTSDDVGRPKLPVWVHLAVFPILCLVYRQWSDAVRRAGSDWPQTNRC